ncbi:L-lactate dehydrogenase A chain-like isoform X2 [Planococcus citri]|uniref:L-lactate dehydrogenase A chain-like isoform X2 n=1 Tax=Planococcus citri TaxID=170843 RepID=UPI0031FA148E
MIKQENDENDCDARIPGKDGTPAGGSSTDSSDQPRPSSASSDILKDAVNESDLKSRFITEIAPKAPSASNKITIVGTGAVGMACAFSILTQNVSSEIALIDLNEDKLKGELLDLQHGATFMKSAKIVAGPDYIISANSKIVVVCAGARQKEGDTRLSLMQKNLAIFKTMIPGLVKHSPSAIFLIVSNPVDILTYLTWKLSGLPRNRVIGSGTNLDSARFQFLLSQKMDIAAESIKGWIIGEHGDSSVPVWSGVTVGGVLLKELYPKMGAPDDPDNWMSVWKDVVESAYNIIKLKGFTCWAIGLSVADLLQTIIRNSNKVHAVSTDVKGFYGITDEVFLSLPCVLGENGVSSIVKLGLTDEEISKLQKSAKIMAEHISELKM